MLDFNIVILILLVIAGYLIGSISPSIIISKLQGIDILKKGSGNAGSTNVFRVLGPKFGLCVFILDFIKAFITTFLVIYLVNVYIGYFVGIAVIVGHIFSIFYKFKAGKGVATSVGVIFAVNWLLGLIVFGFGILLVLITKRVSVGSCCSAVVLPFLCWFLAYDFLPFAIVICLLLIFTHRQNIVRLFKGQENPLW